MKERLLANERCTVVHSGLFVGMTNQRAVVVFSCNSGDNIVVVVVSGVDVVGGDVVDGRVIVKG